MENPASANVQLTEEETDELLRSRKKIVPPVAPCDTVVSYKDSLLGGDHGSLASMAEMDTTVMDGFFSEDDDLLKESCMEGDLRLNLDAEERRRIRQRWTNSLIVKTVFDDEEMGTKFQSLGSFLHVGGHLGEVTELPVEYFDLEILQKNGKSIGVLLRVDGHTLAGEKGKYARICVQVSLEKPLLTYIKVEGRKQDLVYESMGLLCFQCGKLGHIKSQCLDRILQAKDTSVVSLEGSISMQADSLAATKVTAPGNAAEEDADLWRVVTRRHNSRRKNNGNPSGSGNNQ
ncbi:hypothetical protein REPUB_Repub04eG0174300 [Reevesia pubescens]